MLALQFHRSAPRIGLVKLAGVLQEAGPLAALSSGRDRARQLATGPLSMLQLGDIPEPELPGPGWVRLTSRVSGICGSDLAAILGHASYYLDPLTSYPFVPGHELVGRLEDGTRVVVEPALGCVVRGVTPLCQQCAAGRTGLCENSTDGVIETGLQTGYCRSTGGGWGEHLVAHESQLHEVPEQVSDEAACAIEPLACAVHSALRPGIGPDDLVVIYGAGMLGLLTLAAVRQLTSPRRVLVVAKHGHQRDLARALGADQVIAPDELFQRVRFAASGRLLEGAGAPVLLGGADVVFDCVGSGESITATTRVARGRGRLVLVGMPGEERVDWAAVWQRELQVMGAYAYGQEPALDGRRTFEIALELAPRLDLGRLVGPLYSLGDYAKAIEYAAAAGRMGAVRVAFDLRELNP